MTKFYLTENAQISNLIFSNGNILRKPPFPVDGHIYDTHAGGNEKEPAKVVEYLLHGICECHI